MPRLFAALVSSLALAALGENLSAEAQIPTYCVEGSLAEFQTGCREPLFAKAELELTSAYSAAIETMRGRDSLTASDKQNEVRLVEAQMAWVSFRDAQCRHDASIYAGIGGSGFGQAFYECRIRMTRERAVYLKKVPEAFGGN